MFHKMDYAIFACSRKVELSCFCSWNVTFPGLNEAWEISRADFGPTLAAEKLAERDDFPIVHPGVGMAP